MIYEKAAAVQNAQRRLLAVVAFGENVRLVFTVIQSMPLMQGETVEAVEFFLVTGCFW